MKNLDKALSYWCEVLDLESWVIRVCDNCCFADFENINGYGECTYDLTHKTALIKLIDKKYVIENPLYEYDKETTLVHELLHCKFALIDNSGNDIVDRIIHQFISDFACALIKVKREKENE